MSAARWVPLALTAVACWGPPPREATIAVTPPLAEAHVRGDELFVQLTPGTPLAAVVRIPIEPLRPGMTLNEARKELGDPVATRQEADTVYYAYRQAPDQVELVRYSGSGEDWFVAATPADNAVTRVFAPSVQEAISRATHVRRITIQERRNRRQAFTGDVHEGRVFRLQWHEAEG